MDYAVIDVETTEIADGEIPKTKFWGYADEHGYKDFKTSKALCKFLDREAEPRVLLHHSNFDVIQLLVDGTENIWPQKSHNNKLITCLFGHHWLLNSYSTFPLSLGQIFSAFGYKKSSLDNLEQRNYEDCVNGLDCFLRLNDLFNQLVFVEPLKKHTIAGTGFAAAEKCAGKLPKCLLFLDAYRGGRVEVFDLREQEASNYDINSSYPRSFLEAPEETELWEIEVNSSDWFCPLFDADTTDLLLFPNGNFRSYVFSDVWDNYIAPNCEKTKIKIRKRTKIDLTWLTKLRPLIETVYERKENSTGGVKLACKLILNSMYGRIGLKGESERCRILDYEPDGDDIAIYPLGNGRNLVFDKVIREPRSNFSFAAYITDNARGRLFQSFYENNALYGDTDSLFTANKGFKGEQGNQCGQWKFEGRGAFKALNVKDYTFDGEETRKGGSGGVNWTLKRFARGLSAKQVNRERITQLRKRKINDDGTTEPLKISLK